MPSGLLVSPLLPCGVGEPKAILAHRESMVAKLVFAILLVGASASTAPTASIPTVQIRNFAFVPASLTVRAGATVRFVNDDQDAHTVTGKGFDSGGLDSGAVWAHRFTRPGIYAYVCALHPYMRGRIVVVAKAGGKK